MRALLVSNGDIEDLDLLNSEAVKADFVLAADGGMNYCFKAGIRPDLIIGDMDSIDRSLLSHIERSGIEVLKHPTRKNATDTELCLDYLIDKGFKSITMLGSLGSRMDHSLANIYLLEYLLDRNVDGRLLDDKNDIYLVDSIREFEAVRKNISIIPITDEGIVVSLEGLEYPLDHKFIERSSSLGISNEFKNSIARVKIHKGRALVVLSDD